MQLTARVLVRKLTEAQAFCEQTLGLPLQAGQQMVSAFLVLDRASW